MDSSNNCIFKTLKNISLKKLVRIAVIIVLVIGGVFIAAHFVVKNKITSALDKEVKKGNLEYATVSLNLLKGHLAIDSLAYRFKTNQISAKKIEIEGFGVYSYLVENKIHADKISVEKPNINLVKQNKPDSLPKKEPSKTKLKKPIDISEIEISHGKLSLQNDSLTLLEVDDYNLHLNNVEVSTKSLENKIPFNYKTYDITSGKIKYHINKIQDLEVDSLEIETHNVVVHHIHLIPNYSKADYVKVIPYEKDLMDMTMQTLRIHDYQLDLSSPHGSFSTPKVEMDSIDLNIFRDKRVKDDPRKKKLYSQMLRDLPLKLNIDSLKINRMDLSYQELQEKTGKTGEVVFNSMEIDAAHITNMDLARKDFPETTFDISSKFMGESSLNVNWEFKVNDPKDQFRIKGQGYGFSPKGMNAFFTPAFNMETTGGIEKLYFDFYGDKNTAQGQLKMVYDNFKIKVLRKNSKQKNGFLSFVANIFVHKKAKTKDAPVDVKGVKRDKTKSFWNYFWKCIFAGLKKTLI